VTRATTDAVTWRTTHLERFGIYRAIARVGRMRLWVQQGMHGWYWWGETWAVNVRSHTAYKTESRARSAAVAMARVLNAPRATQRTKTTTTGGRR